METQTIICLVVFVITLVCYVLNKWPIPLVSMTALAVYVVTGCLTPKAARARHLLWFTVTDSSSKNELFITSVALTK